MKVLGFCSVAVVNDAAISQHPVYIGDDAGDVGNYFLIATKDGGHTMSVQCLFCEWNRHRARGRRPQRDQVSDVQHSDRMAKFVNDRQFADTLA